MDLKHQVLLHPKELIERTLFPKQDLQRLKKQHLSSLVGVGVGVAPTRTQPSTTTAGGRGAALAKAAANADPGPGAQQPQQPQPQDFSKDDWGVAAYMHALLGLTPNCTTTTPSSLAASSRALPTHLRHALPLPALTIEDVPSLNQLRSDQIKPGALVKFRCMVQDVRGPEFYPGVYTETKTTGTTTIQQLKTGKYCDAIDTKPGVTLDLTPAGSVTYDRTVLLCIALPGENQWVKHQLHNNNQHAAAAASTSGSDGSGGGATHNRNNKKRGREHRPMLDIDDTHNDNSVGAAMDGDNLQEQNQRKRTVPAAVAASNSATATFNSHVNGHTHNLKDTAAAPEEPASTMSLMNTMPQACLVKVYDTTDETQFKVGSAIEFVGILSADPGMAIPSLDAMAPPSHSRNGTGMAHGDRGDDDTAMQTDVLAAEIGVAPAAAALLQDYVPPASQAVRLHALMHRVIGKDMPYPFAQPLTTDVALSVRAQVLHIRQSLLLQIAASCAGDTLAAEFVLMNMLSRVHSRPHGQVIGPFAVNLSLPRHDSDNSLHVDAKHVSHALLQAYRRIVPATIPIELSPTALSAKAIHPVKNYETNMLEYGILQAPAGTCFIVDETQMAAGTMNETGLKNLRALVKIALTSKLEYDFKWNVLEFDADNPLVVVSAGKSLLPNHVRVPVAPTCSPVEAVKALPVPTEDDMATFRQYIQVARVLECPVAESTSKSVESYFVETRKRFRSFGSDQLHLLLNLARLVAASFLEEEVSVERWVHACTLMEKLSARVATPRNAGAAAAPAWCTVPSYKAAAATSQQPQQKRN